MTDVLCVRKTEHILFSHVDVQNIFVNENMRAYGYFFWNTIYVSFVQSHNTNPAYTKIYLCYFIYGLQSIPFDFSQVLALLIGIMPITALFFSSYLHSTVSFPILKTIFQVNLFYVLATLPPVIQPTMLSAEGKTTLLFKSLID